MASNLNKSAPRQAAAPSDVALPELALSNCGREPIHTPGYIQPFGALIVTDRALETITHVSANLGDILGRPPEQWTGADALGQSLRSLLSYELVHELCNACGLPTIGLQPERLGAYLIGQHDAGQPLEVSVHISKDHTLIELSTSPINPTHSGKSILLVKAMLDQLPDTESMLATAVQTLRKKTGFDRVMAYQFLPDGTGEVIAEAKAPALAPFLGLRYPASDIPEQVRSLALKTSLRVIHDTQAAPVPILALNQSAPPIDLSLVNLRSVSPIHLEYLENMGIQSTVNISITVGKKLWGLFAFHHTHSRQISPELCDMLALFGQFFSLRLQQTLAEEKFLARKRTASILETLVNQNIPGGDWRATIIQAHAPLRSLLLAQGIAFIGQPTTHPPTRQPATNSPPAGSSPPQVDVFGDVPPLPSILALVSHYQNHADTNIVSFESLQQLNLSIPENSPDNTLGRWGRCAGALLFTLPSATPFHLVFFRNEVIHEVRWGGNPEKKEIVYGDFGPRLKPRASFEEYQQTVQGRCEAWNEQDWAIALEIRTELLRLVEDRIQDFQQRQQDLLIAELNHRVKNILALIRSIARQTKESTTSLTDYATMLEQRISALTTAHELVAGQGLEWPDLAQLLLIELRPYISNTQPRVTLLGLAVGLKANFVPTFVLVLHELATNAAKYGALSTNTGQLIVRWQATDGGLTLNWKESGGPVVTPPTRSGFGRELIERAIPYEFEGEAALHFHPTGLEAEFWLPSSLVRWQATSSKTSKASKTSEAQPTNPPANSKKDSGSILIVEDNLLLTMEMENTLKQLGFSQIDSAPTVAKALKLLDHNQYRVCVLDINLKKETSFEIARTLVHRHIPFVFTSGYDSTHVIPEDLTGQRLVKKPVELAKLKAALQALVQL